MVETGARESDEELALLPHQNNGDRSWRLNFDGFQLTPEHKDVKKPPRSLHDCLGVLGNFKFFFLIEVFNSIVLIYYQYSNVLSFCWVYWILSI